MSLDAVLTSNFDLQIDSDGDILTDDFLDTALTMSLFCERRAASSEVFLSEYRRGWIGNESTPEFEIGSKIWLYEQSRVTRTVLTAIETAVIDALQWLIDDNIADDISVTITLSNSMMTATINIDRPNSKVDKRYFELWENTGVR